MGRPLFPAVAVNGTTISAAAIAAEAQNHAAPANKPGWAWHAAARALAVRELLRQEAACRGIRPDPRPQPGGRRETDEEAAIRQLLELELNPVAPTEPELRAAHAEAPEAIAALPFEAARDRVATAVERRRWAEAARAFTERLIAAATLDGVSFDQETLARQRVHA